MRSGWHCWQWVKEVLLKRMKDPTFSG